MGTHIIPYFPTSNWSQQMVCIKDPAIAGRQLSLVFCHKSHVLDQAASLKALSHARGSASTESSGYFGIE